MSSTQFTQTQSKSKKNMKGSISSDVSVAAPTSIVWSVYRGKELLSAVNKLLSNVVGFCEVLEGDGGVGTIVKITFVPGTPGVGYMKEVFTKMDDEVRVKETETIEGGYLAMGFDVFKVRLEVLENGEEESVIRSSVEYEIADEFADRVEFVSVKSLEVIAEAVGKYVVEEYSNKKMLQ